MSIETELKILKEYSKIRRKNEFELEKRKDEVYKAVPESQALENQKKQEAFSLGIKLSKCKDDLQREQERSLTRQKISAITKQIYSLLEKAGFPRDYMDMKYNCSSCKDTGFLDIAHSKKCSCFVNKLLEYEYDSSKIIPEECFENFRFDVYRNAEQRKAMIDVKSYCEEYANNFPNTKINDILLRGDPGLGKTFLENCIAKRAIERGFSVQKYTAYNIIEIIMKNIRSGFAVPSFTESDLLIIDDLGSEPLINNITVEYMFSILNERRTAKKHTVIATNLSFDNIQERYDLRFFSRLTSLNECKVITLKGDDLRLSR